MENKPSNPRMQEFDGMYANDAYASSKDAFTLRDYFAAKAMQAIIGRLGGRATFVQAHEQDTFEMVAAESYRYADSMLTQRQITQE